MKTLVFYSQNTRDTGEFGHGDPRAYTAVRNGREYLHICSFEQAESLEAVWEAMQSEVSTIPQDIKARSMMVGDIILHDDKVFVVDSCGFKELEDVSPMVYVGPEVSRQIWESNPAPVFATATRGIR